MNSNEMEREKAFLSLLQEAVKKARKNGNMISEEEITELFGPLDLTGEQLGQVRDYLKAAKIGIGEALSMDDILSEEEHDYLDDYLSLIREIPQPAQGEADALRLSAMAGDEQAQKRLAEVMLIRVVDIARLYAGQDVLIEDLIGAGNEALARGVKLLAPLETPDEVDGALGRRIMDAMEDLISQRIDERAADRDVEDLVNRVAKEAGELAQDLGRKVTVAELAREGVVSEEEILRAIRFSGGKIEELEAP
ncbi:MAG: hypothetical protein IJI62_06755 [Lachnospiraceae bacterium]|nr:hypothetical protein [Lachnospiraceae bacterium]